MLAELVWHKWSVDMEILGTLSSGNIFKKIKTS